MPVHATLGLVLVITEGSQPRLLPAQTSRKYPLQGRAAHTATVHPLIIHLVPLCALESRSSARANKEVCVCVSKYCGVLECFVCKYYAVIYVLLAPTCVLDLEG